MKTNIIHKITICIPPKFKTYVFQKTLLMEMKRQATGWNDTPESRVFGKSPEFRIHEELLKLK